VTYFARGVVLCALLSLGCAQAVEIEPPPSSQGDCDEGFIDCGDACVDPLTDPKNCGSCGNDCNEGVCVEGACADECPPGTLECEPGSCSDISVDPVHCGSCTNACPPDQTCLNASCTCAGSAPDECPDGCTNVLTDPQNCGICGLICAPNESCVNGSCAPQCAPGDTLCGTECVDVSSDDAHCGSCFNACPPGSECNSFTCVCSTQQCGACAPQSLSSTVPQTVTGTTFNALNSLEPVCAALGAADVAYTFTAPSTANFAFDTIGSTFDTVLYAFDGLSCTLLACDDDTFGVESFINMPLNAGQQVVVVVDGFAAGDAGPFTLNVSSPPPCPTAVLGPTTPQSVVGNSSSSVAYYSSSCGGPGPEDSYAFTAPSTGLYVFDTIGSSIDTVIYARDFDCMGFELGCDDNGGGGSASQLALNLFQGQTIVLFVDAQSGGGAYTLNVSGPPPPPPCPTTNLGSALPQSVSGDTTLSASAYTGTCAGFGPENTYSFTAPVTGTYQIDTIGSAYDTVVHVRDTDCNGPELGCDDDSGGNFNSLVVVNLVQGQTVAIFADSYSSGGSYVLNISPPPPCPALSLGSISPQTVMGNTSGGSNLYVGSCAGSGLEDSYSFTAPANGTYTFDTIGSPYDTVLHVRDGTCGGLELACDDDAGGNLTSLLSVTLAQGQQVVVFVDSFFGSGPYSFHVSGP